MEVAVVVADSVAQEVASAAEAKAAVAVMDAPKVAVMAVAASEWEMAAAMAPILGGVAPRQDVLSTCRV